MDKVGRNDPCPCGSGKKFKKCCEAKMASKTFAMRKIEEQKSQVGNLSKLFHSLVKPEHLTESPPPSEGESPDKNP